MASIAETTKGNVAIRAYRQPCQSTVASTHPQPAFRWELQRPIKVFIK